MKDQVSAVTVNLKVADSTALLILLSADGTVNRIGTGSVNNSEHDVYIGRTKDRLFEQFMEGIDESVFQHMGHYDLPNQKGATCTLTLAFMIPADADGRDYTGIEFVYGSESEGPPGQIAQMVKTAVRLTDPWYHEQKRMVAVAERNQSSSPKQPFIARLLQNLRPRDKP